MVPFVVHSNHVQPQSTFRYLDWTTVTAAGAGTGRPSGGEPSADAVPGGGGPRGVGTHHPAPGPGWGWHAPGGWGPHRGRREPPVRGRARGPPRRVAAELAGESGGAADAHRMFDLRRGRHFRTCTPCSDARTTQGGALISAARGKPIVAHFVAHRPTPRGGSWGRGGVGRSPPGTPAPPGAACPRGWGFTHQPSAPGGGGEAPPQGCPVPPPRGLPFHPHESRGSAAG